MKILILGAAGELAGKVTEALLKQTKAGWYCMRAMHQTA